jgi:uncharacterized membrane protein
LTSTSSKALALVFAAAYAAYGLVRHWHFGSSAYDLGIFDQVVWHLSRFEAPASTVHGYANMFGDHFSPMLALWAPLYWIRAAPEMLIVAQAALLGASILPVHAFLRDRLPGRAAFLFAIAYGLFWGMQRTAAFDVHEMAFAPLLIALAILAIDRRNWPLFLVSAVLLCGVKEDLIPLVAACGALWWLRGERVRGAAVAIGGVLVFLLVVKWVIPALSSTGGYSVGGSFSGVLNNPSSIFTELVTPPVKLETMGLWLLPFLFLPLASPLALLIVPLALERFLSSSPNHWGTAFHYSAPLAPILVMAAADGLARLGRRIDNPATRGRVITGAAAASLVLCAFVPGHQPLLKLFTPEFYRSPAFAATASLALDKITPSASVVAQASLVPHLSRRQEIFTLRADGRTANADADFVIAAPADLNSWPFADAADVERQLAAYRIRGYVPIFEQSGWIVLRRTDR